MVDGLLFWLVGRGRRALDLLPPADRALSPLIVELALCISRSQDGSGFAEARLRRRRRLDATLLRSACFLSLSVV